MLPERARTCPGRVPVLPGLILERVWRLLGTLRRLLDIPWALLSASWAPLGRSWAPLDWSEASFVCIVALEDVPDRILEASGNNFDGPGTFVLEDLLHILSNRDDENEVSICQSYTAFALWQPLTA